MAASAFKEITMSKAEYLKRYLSADRDAKKSNEKKTKKKRVRHEGKGMKIVDDDVDWQNLVANPKETETEDEEEAPVVADVIDERPEEVKRLEAFRSSTKWRLMGGSKEDLTESQGSRSTISSGDESSRQTDEQRKNTRHDSPEMLSRKQTRHDSPEMSSQKQTRHDSPEMSSRRQTRYDSTDLPSSTQRADGGLKSTPLRTQSRDNTVRKKAQTFPNLDQSPRRRQAHVGQSSDSDQSPPRRQARVGKTSDSDQSPPRRQARVGQNSDSDQSPLRMTPQMLSGGAAGLVSLDVLRKEQEEKRRREKKNLPLEEQSRNAQTVFRDKTGKKRDVELEREEQRRKAGEKTKQEEKYKAWGKGVIQGQIQQQNVESALLESQKPLARHIDDADLDRLLREQQRDGDPMAAMLSKKRNKDAKLRGVKEKPHYKGPAPPPNRFNITPGYRWDGVDRSNGFEQKRYSRMADKRALQDMAYKWSVEDM